MAYGDFPPYNIRQNGRPSGLAADVFALASARSGVPIEWVPVTLQDPDVLLDTGTVDVVPMVGVTADRDARYELSAPWWFFDTVVAVLESSGIRAPDQLRGKRVAVRNGRLARVIGLPAVVVVNAASF